MYRPCLIVSQIAWLRWANLGPTMLFTSGQCWQTSLGQCYFAHRLYVGPTCRAYIGPTCWAYVSPTHWSNYGPPRWSNIGPPCWSNIDPTCCNNIGPTYETSIVHNSKQCWTYVGPTQRHVMGHCNCLIIFTDPLWWAYFGPVALCNLLLPGHQFDVTQHFVFLVKKTIHHLKYIFQCYYNHKNNQINLVWDRKIMHI